MKVRLIAVGTRMPQWVQQGIAEYEKRITRELGFSIAEVALERRSKSRTIDQNIQKEGEALLRHVHRDDFVIALEIKGRTLDTATLARRLDEMSPDIRDLFSSLESFLYSLGDDVQRKDLKVYIAFKRLRNFTCVVILKGKLVLLDFWTFC